MIHDHVDRSTGTFEEVSPDMESLKDCEQFFVMGVIIEFQGTEGVGMESHGVDFIGIGLYGEDGTQSVIGGIGFYNDRFIEDPVGQDRCGGESEFQGLEGFLGGIGKVPRNTLVGQLGKRNHNVGIIGNEAAVKISKAKKRLNVCNLAGLRPILNSLNLGGIHLQSIFREDEHQQNVGILVWPGKLDNICLRRPGQI